MPIQTVQEAAQERWPITDKLTPSDRSLFEMWHRMFTDGASWQKERDKDMVEALQELLRFHGVLREAASLLQYEDNFLKAIDAAKVALSKALD
jgi:hypothetical protein